MLAMQRLIRQAQVYGPVTRRLFTATLESRLRDEVVSANGVQQLPTVVGAWARSQSSPR